jgi:ribose/xylose/arabinose/galactoside ABC-type transport system permease subunit
MRALRHSIRRLPESVLTTLPLLAAIVGLGVYTASKSDVFLSQANLQNLFEQISVLGLVTVGMTLLMVAGLLDLSVGALASFIAVIAARLAADGTSVAAIIPIGIGVGLGVGLLTGIVVGVVRVPPFILTIGSWSVFVSLGLVLTEGQPIGVDAEAFTTIGIGRRFGIPIAGMLFIGALIFGALLLRYTRLGRNAYAMGSNPQAAFLAGVPIARVTIGLFALSGLLVGIAGIVLLGRLGAGDATAGVGLELQAVAAVVLGGASLSGGRGTIWGSFLGVVLLGEISNSLNVLGTQLFYQELVYGSVLIIAVVATALREEQRLQAARAMVGSWNSRIRRERLPTEPPREEAAIPGSAARSEEEPRVGERD